MQALTPQPINKYLIRPATIAIRFKNETEYKNALVMYENILGVKPTASDTLQSWSISQGTNGAEGTELRLSLQTALEPRTTIYWRVTEANYSAVKKILIDSNGLKLGGTELATDVDSVAGRERPKRSVFLDASSNRMGIVINPPIPKWRHEIKTNVKPRSGAFIMPKPDADANYPLLLGVGGAGLLLGFVLSRFSRRG